MRISRRTKRILVTAGFCTLAAASGVQAQDLQWVAGISSSYPPSNQYNIGTVVGNTLYATSGDSIIGINLSTYQQTTLASGELGGMAFGPSGNIYGANGDSIDEFNTTSDAVTTVASLSSTIESGLVSNGAGDFYGTTNNGEIFEFNATTDAVSSLATIGGNVEPEVGAISSGVLYGTTYLGGSGYGTVFDLSLKAGGTVNTLATFNGAGGGQYPVDVAMGAPGELVVGTHYYDNPEAGINTYGSVLELNLSNDSINVETVFTDDNEPYSMITDGKGDVFGTAGYWGGTYNYPNPYDLGVIFEVNSTGQYSTLYSFGVDNDAGEPTNGLAADRDGNLYGAVSDPADISTSLTTTTWASIYELSHSGFAPVPEPSSLGLLAIAGTAALTRWRRRRPAAT